MATFTNAFIEVAYFRNHLYIEQPLKKEVLLQILSVVLIGGECSRRKTTHDGDGGLTPKKTTVDKLRWSIAQSIGCVTSGL